MNKWLELLVGLVLVVAGVYAWGVNYWGLGNAAVTFFKGGLVWLVLLIGALFVMLGINDLRE